MIVRLRDPLTLLGLVLLVGGLSLLTAAFLTWGG